MSSKRAAGEAGKELLLHLLRLIDRRIPVPGEHSRKLYYLRRNGYITREPEGYTLSLKGVRTLSEEAVWGLTIPTPARWDGRWRLVLFDIPNDKRKRRDAFRSRLKEMGLVLYQQSVWVYPYPLEDTVRSVAAFYKLAGCISFITAEKVTGDAALRRHFKLD